MIHYLDIPKTSKADEGTVKCFARNIMGEAETTCQLRINPKTDFRSVLRNVKTGEPVVIEQEEPDEEAKARAERRKNFLFFSSLFFIFIYSSFLK
jgi:hypothetical protein